MSRFILAFLEENFIHFTILQILKKRAVSSLKALNQGIIYPQNLIQNFIISSQSPTINRLIIENIPQKTMFILKQAVSSLQKNALH
jgi:hypothetical protein